jgi:two-component system, OmpR family, sensor histidine kinase CpxA
MRFPAQSLFLKIFLWFWATAIVTSISLIITFILGPGSVPAQWHSSLADTARSSGTIAIAEYEKGGSSAASVYLERFEHDTQLRTCLFAQNGGVIAGTHCETFSHLRDQVALTNKPYFAVRYGIARVALMLPGPGTEEYIFATELPAGPRVALGSTAATVLLRFSVALAVSGFICYLLAHYLTSPILKLRIAAQELAAGNLSTRAAHSLTRRKDEIGDLVLDFNVMATRMEELVSRQRQLIYDISHELRSPLARLNVALDLGRRRKGSDPAFDRMESDLERLSEMIGRLLTIARLDLAPTSIERSEVDLAELVAQIAHDADFESQKRHVTVRLAANQDCVVSGNAALLHSAIENVIRNAILYTEQNSAVDIVLEREQVGGTTVVHLSIRDHGPGVPESDLDRIFQPFYRTAEARDRASGGAGLGLAISSRVIQAHCGSIRARNLEHKGLEIRISLSAIPTKILSL